MTLLVPAAIITAVKLHQTGLVTTVSVRLAAGLSLNLSSVSSANGQAKPLSLSKQAVWLTHRVANAYPCDRHA